MSSILEQAKETLSAVQAIDAPSAGQAGPTKEVPLSEFSQTIKSELGKIQADVDAKRGDTAKARLERLRHFTAKATNILQGVKEGDAEPKIEIFDGDPPAWAGNDMAASVAAALAPALTAMAKSIEGLTAATKTKKDEEGKDGEGAEGKDGEGAEGKDGEGAEGKDGEGKDGEGKDGEGKDGEGKDGEGKDGEGKDGITAEDKTPFPKDLAQAVALEDADAKIPAGVAKKRNGITADIDFGPDPKEVLEA